MKEDTSIHDINYWPASLIECRSVYLNWHLVGDLLRDLLLKNADQYIGTPQPFDDCAGSRVYTNRRQRDDCSAQNVIDQKP